MTVDNCITPSTAITGGIDLLHYSNVGVRVPNFGINSFNVCLGLAQRVAGAGPTASTNTFFYPHKGSVEFGGDFGMRGQPYSKNEFYRTGFYAGYNYQLSSVFSLKGGFDAGYYFTPFSMATFDQTFAEYGSSYEKWRGGVSIGGDMALGRLVMALCSGSATTRYCFLRQHANLVGEKINSKDGLLIRLKEI